MIRQIEGVLKTQSGDYPDCTLTVSVGENDLAGLLQDLDGKVVKVTVEVVEE